MANVSMQNVLKERALARKERAWAELKINRELIEKRMEMQTGSETIPKNSPQIELLNKHGVLDVILKYITDPEEIIAFSNVCEGFQMFLQPRMKAFNVMQEALHIAIERYFPSVFYPGHSDRKYILRLRQMNKSMKKAVDKYLFEKTLSEEFQETSRDLNQPQPLILPLIQCSNAGIRLRLQTLDEVNSAISVLSGTTDKISFRRDIAVLERRFQQPETLSAFRAGIIRLLEMVGGSIWSFHYVTSDYKAVDSYEHMCNFMKLMPNLKALNLVLNGSGFENGEEMQALAQKIVEFPPPSLPSLKVCDVRSVSKNCNQVNLAQFILYAIIRENPGIQRTELDFARATENMLDLPASFQPAGVTLHIDSIPTVLTTATWPLKTLDLQFVGIESLSSAILLPAIEKFKDTLICLHIGRMKLEDDHKTTLDLPRLKSFSGKFDPQCENWDFMIPLYPIKSLEKLTLNGCFNHQSFGDSFQSNKFKRLYGKKLLCQIKLSKIPKIFPFLNQVNISVLFGQHLERIQHSWTRKADLFKFIR